MLIRQTDKGQEITAKQNRIMQNLKGYIECNYQKEKELEGASKMLDQIFKADKDNRLMKNSNLQSNANVNTNANTNVNTNVNTNAKEQKILKQNIQNNSTANKVNLKETGKQIRFSKLEDKSGSKLETELQKLDSQNNKNQVKQESKEKEDTPKQQNQENGKEQSNLDNLESSEDRLRKAVKLLQSVDEVEKQLQKA